MHIPCIIFPLFSPALPPAAQLSLPPAARLSPRTGYLCRCLRPAAYFTVISTEESAVRSPEFPY